jgi:hypothetical protein
LEPFWLLPSAAFGCPSAGPRWLPSGVGFASPAPLCSPSGDVFWFELLWAVLWGVFWAVSCGIPHEPAFCPPWALLANPLKDPFTAVGAMSNGAVSASPSAMPIDFVKSCFMTPASSF